MYPSRKALLKKLAMRVEPDEGSFVRLSFLVALRRTEHGVALLLNCQQYFNLHAHSARRAPLGDPTA
jgi:hypothetical protein